MMFGDISMIFCCDTIDGRNPLPRYINLVNNGMNYISTGAGFLPSTVVHTCDVLGDVFFPLLHIEDELVLLV